MPEAATIAKIVIPAEPTNKSGKIENPNKSSKHQSVKSSEDHNLSENPNPAQDATNQPFYRVYQDKLDKSEKKPKENKKQKQTIHPENQEQTAPINVVKVQQKVLPVVSNQTKAISSDKNSAKGIQTISGKRTENQKINMASHLMNAGKNKENMYDSLKSDVQKDNKNISDAQKNVQKENIASLLQHKTDPKIQKEIPRNNDPVNKSGPLESSPASSLKTLNPMNEVGEKQDVSGKDAAKKLGFAQIQANLPTKISRADSRPEMTKAIQNTAETKQNTHQMSAKISKKDTKNEQPFSSLKENKTKNQGMPEIREKTNSSSELPETHTDLSRQPFPGKQQISFSEISTRTNPIHSTESHFARSISSAADQLSPAQQILRGIQTGFEHEIRTIQVSLSPAGLGMVRIQLQQEGGEISGILEVEKADTRREIEKSLPQIIAVLDNQGLGVRKIEVASMPNSNQRQSSFEGSNEWALNQEMMGQKQSRHQMMDLSHREPVGIGPSINQNNTSHDPANRNEMHNDLENLNFFA